MKTMDATTAATTGQCSQKATSEPPTPVKVDNLIQKVQLQINLARDSLKVAPPAPKPESQDCTEISYTPGNCRLWCWNVNGI